MKRFLSAASSIVLTLFAAYSQSVVEIRLPQNPLFEVSTNSVNAAIPDGTGSLTLGGDIVVKGGSGTYAYRWYTPAGAELGTAAELTVTDGGKYLLDITDTCDCLQTVEFNITSASVDDAFVADVAVTPNPTDGYIEFIGFEAVQLSATSLGGQLAALINASAGTFSSADLSHLAAGAYIVVLTDARGRVFTTKLIKK